MGRLIDCNDVYNAIQITTDDFGVAKRVVEDNMLTMLSNIKTVEAIPKADYEARLKADLVAMLEDLKQDFIAEAYGIEMDCTNYVVNVADIDKVIQQKINALKESEPQESEEV